MRQIELSDEEALILLNILENEIWDLQIIKTHDHDIEEDLKRHIKLLQEIKEKLLK